VTFAAITALFVVIVIVSALLPALRAARVDPVIAIRQP
jgi:ABC-type antimicrobial peptide transport system permease subunit